MALEIVWSNAARDDLRDVENYLQTKDSRAADRWVGAIYDLVDSLVQFPELGPVVKGDESGKRRWLPCGNYRLVYRYAAGEERVYILSVTHSSRETPPPR